MNTVQIWQTVSTSSDATLNLAAALGRKLRGGEVLELISDLGGGKTTFVKGLAQGIGSSDHVHSPSFTLTNQYRGPRLTIDHFDLYRLQGDAGVIKNELAELLDAQNSVVVVEWPALIDNVLPADRLSVNIKVIEEDSRQIKFTYPRTLSYLFPSDT